MAEEDRNVAEAAKHARIAERIAAYREKRTSLVFGSNPGTGKSLLTAGIFYLVGPEHRRIHERLEK